MGYDIGDLLQLIVAERGDALHLYVGAAPVLEIARQLYPIGGPPLADHEPQRMLSEIGSADDVREVERAGLASFKYEFIGGARFQVMAFREAGHVRLELRRFVDDVPNDAA